MVSRTTELVITNVDGDVETWGPQALLEGTSSDAARVENVGGFLERKAQNDPKNPLLGVHPGELKTDIHTETHTQIS